MGRHLNGLHLQNQNLHSLLSKDLTAALELGYLKGGCVIVVMHKAEIGNGVPSD